MFAMTIKSKSPIKNESASLPFESDEARWAAVVRRDQNADGTFYYSVRTTGVYCRPSCGARLPRRENVHFHSSRADAFPAGFRACRRCRPDQPALAAQRAAAVAKTCRLIETADEMPTSMNWPKRQDEPLSLSPGLKSTTG
jgi:AraC family transcriptional regulator of adaptative response/methylated-DNA-[protein]-cysteine methyltransferase